MAKIIINRKRQWMNSLRGIRILVDGKYARSISNGGTEEISLQPGKHIISCEIDWCASKPLEVDLKENDVWMLKLESGMKYMMPVYIIFFAGILLRFSFRVTAQHVPDWVDFVQFAVFVPLLIYFFYYLTFGRKRYLSLEKDTDSIFNN